jgi:hypothetical protein
LRSFFAKSQALAYCRVAEVAVDFAYKFGQLAVKLKPLLD